MPPNESASVPGRPAPVGPVPEGDIRASGIPNSAVVEGSSPGCAGTDVVHLEYTPAGKESMGDSLVDHRPMTTVMVGQRSLIRHGLVWNGIHAIGVELVREARYLMPFASRDIPIQEITRRTSWNSCIRRTNIRGAARRIAVVDDRNRVIAAAGRRARRPRGTSHDDESRDRTRGWGEVVPATNEPTNTRNQTRLNKNVTKFTSWQDVQHAWIGWLLLGVTSAGREAGRQSRSRWSQCRL
jgi:hypothetical protein